MPAAGTVTIMLQPSAAAAVARWIENRPASVLEAYCPDANQSERSSRTELSRRLRSFSERKRRKHRFAPISLQLTREQAHFLALNVRRGLFGSGRPRLPHSIEAACQQCSIELAKRRGAPKHRGIALEAAIKRQRRNISDSLGSGDPRWLKRLRKRKRQEEASAT